MYSFAFLVLCYNHERYIIEHLESIKFLINTYADNIDVDLIINDDASTDETKDLIDKWLLLNCSIFRHVDNIYNEENIGTCRSIDKMLTFLKADRCKMTAGDDVYSYENIFEFTKCDDDVCMVSGRVVNILDKKIIYNPVFNFLITATQLVYEKNTLLHRFKHFSINNAPNIFYATKCLMNSNVRKYLIEFDVVEDWPIQISIAREFEKSKFILIDKVFVYYRRTPGSTYIIANDRFSNDKLNIYDDLIFKETNLLCKIRLMSRKWCFKSNRQWVNKILNLDFYFFILSVVFNIKSIFQKNIEADLKVDQHSLHYKYICSLASDFSDIILKDKDLE